MRRSREDVEDLVVEDDNLLEVSDVEADEQARAHSQPGSDLQDEGVLGERGRPQVDRAQSIQSRASNFLAMGLMTVLGAGLLLWYYSTTFKRQARAQETVEATAKTKAQGDMPLPALGPIEPPRWVEQTSEGPGVPLNPALAAIQDLPPVPPVSSPEKTATPAAAATYAAVPAMPTGPQPKTPEQLALERRLSGAVFARGPQSGGTFNAQAANASLAVAANDAAGQGGPYVGPPSNGVAQPNNEAGEMAPLLRAATTSAVMARVLPTQRLLLSKGAFIDCTLETAIDSTLPGMTTCIIATDTFSVDGKVVLLERGTKLVGETRGQVRQGSARVFVIWTEARTPTGVVVPLDSPGADELGRSGLPGKVNRHFWDRFGAAILISMIDGAVQGAAQSQGNGGTVIYNPSTSEDIMTEVLKSTVNIPPSVVKKNGDRIQVLVARDLDFRSVYELHPLVSTP